MLVLSRKVGERVMVGEDLVITVIRVDRDKVRLGFSAPSAVSILREEVTREGEGEEGVRAA